MKVFVYGTLKRGYHNWHRILKDHAELLGGAETLDRFEMVDWGCPSIYPLSEDGHRVRGEVYEVDVPTLCRLDQLEGEGYSYLRRLVLVTQDSSIDRVELCMTYFGNEQYGRRHGKLVEPVDGVLTWDPDLRRMIPEYRQEVA